MSKHVEFFRQNVSKLSIFPTYKPCNTVEFRHAKILSIILSNHVDF